VHDLAPALSRTRGVHALFVSCAFCVRGIRVPFTRNSRAIPLAAHHRGERRALSRRGVRIFQRRPRRRIEPVPPPEIARQVRDARGNFQSS
jgi:hypothetical protein